MTPVSQQREPPRNPERFRRGTFKSGTGTGKSLLIPFSTRVMNEKAFCQHWRHVRERPWLFKNILEQVLRSEPERKIAFLRKFQVCRLAKRRQILRSNADSQMVSAFLHTLGKKQPFDSQSPRIQLSSDASVASWLKRQHTKTDSINAKIVYKFGVNPSAFPLKNLTIRSQPANAPMASVVAKTAEERAYNASN